MIGLCAEVPFVKFMRAIKIIYINKLELKFGNISMKEKDYLFQKTS